MTHKSHKCFPARPFLGAPDGCLEAVFQARGGNIGRVTDPRFHMVRYMMGIVVI